MKRKLMLIGSVLLVVVVGLYFFAYIYVNRSAAYLASIEFLNGHDDIKLSIGEITSHKLALTGWSLRFLGPKGEAHFKIRLNGTKGSGTTYVYVVSAAGRWEMREANLFLPNGKQSRLPVSP